MRFCECTDGENLDLVYNPATGKCEGTAHLSDCGHSIVLAFYCLGGGTTCGSYRLDVSFGDDCLPAQTLIPAAGCSCDPFSASFERVITPGTASDCGCTLDEDLSSVFRVTITL